MRDINANTRKKLRIIGIPLIIIGIIIMVYSFITFFGNFGNSFDDANQNSMTWFGLSALGMVLLFVGFVMFYFSILRPVSKYVATETSPAITTASHALGKGLGIGIKESGAIVSGSKEIIKIKCPNCGYLESEDAEFCSKCGKKI